MGRTLLQSTTRRKTENPRLGGASLGPVTCSKSDDPMLKSWPVRYQIRLGAGMLFLVIVGLCMASVQGVFKFRNLTKSIRQRALELPLAANLGQAVSDLRRINAQATSQKLEEIGRASCRERV